MAIALDVMQLGLYGNELCPKLCGEFARLEDTPLRNDPGDQFGWRHVEGGIEDGDSGWCDRMAAVNGGDF